MHKIYLVIEYTFVEAFVMIYVGTVTAVCEVDNKWYLYLDWLNRRFKCYHKTIMGFEKFESISVLFKHFLPSADRSL